MKQSCQQAAAEVALSVHDGSRRCIACSQRGAHADCIVQAVRLAVLQPRQGCINVGWHLTNLCQILRGSSVPP